MPSRIDRRSFLKAAAQSTALAAVNVSAQSASGATWKAVDGSLEVAFGASVLRLDSYLEGVLRVRYGSAADLQLQNKSLAVVRTPDRTANLSAKEASGSLSVTGPGLAAVIDLSTGAITFSDHAGQPLLTDLGAGAGSGLRQTDKISRTFHLTTEEAIYGLGQYRNGVLNWRGHALDMVQFNTQAAIPVLLSTQGYGLFWNNPSRTIFEDLQSGMNFTSEEGAFVEYFVIAGPEFDDTLRRYRQLTGPCPMIPRWALGYVQSRNRYHSQEELLSVVRKQRALKLPMDAIFLDYYYWGKSGFGSDLFDKTDFPAPAAMLAELHALHTRLIVSIWPTFSPNCDNYRIMKEHGFLLEGTSSVDSSVVYDAFSPAARKLYWSFLEKSLVPLGIDGWFMDSSEPDAKGFRDSTTALGPARTVENQYPLAHTTAVFEGLHERNPEKRIFIITRCAFAGQQRNAAADWSGDIDTTFLELSLQIPAGLNFCMTGIPYWTTDIGGYLGGDPGNIYYRELFVRWWQFGAFCPLFRAHGRREPVATREAPNELWAYGDEVLAIASKFSLLRYRLLPYLYSLAARTSHDGYTIMRALPFEFREDVATHNIATQFMFGSSIMVCPVLESGARSRSVHLPKRCEWIDFWTGKTHTGGGSYRAEAPLDSMPLLVRAGSILPLGPPAEYTGAAPESLEIRIYPGADTSFTLYEDDGETYACERGECSRIVLRWEQAQQRLVVEARQGAFPGMLHQRTFQLVWVDESHGLGASVSQSGVRVTYDGKQVIVQRPA